MFANGGVGINHCPTTNLRNQHGRSKLKCDLGNRSEADDTCCLQRQALRFPSHLPRVEQSYIIRRLVRCFHVLAFDDDTTVNY